MMESICLLVLVIELTFGMVVVVGTAAVPQVVLEGSEVQGSYDRVHMPVMGPLVIFHVFSSGSLCAC